MIKLKTTDVFERFKEYASIALKDGYVYDYENKDSVYKAIQDISTDKFGVTLLGNPGSGKTFLFEIMQRITHPQDPHFFIRANTLDVVLQFNQKEIGHTVFDKWQTKNVLFDDLGTEHDGKHYGEKVNVFEKFIQFRYELFREKGLKTHFTTNLTNAELLEKYGLRCHTRLMEMNTPILLGAQEKYTNRRQYKNLISLPAVHHEIIKTLDEVEWEKNYNKMKERYAAMPQVKKSVAASPVKTENDKLISKFMNDFDDLYKNNPPLQEETFRRVNYKGIMMHIEKYLQTRLDEYFEIV